MKIRRWITVWLCLVLVMTSLYIPSENVRAETRYDEAKVLDEIAHSWLATCRSNASCCEIGLTLYPIAKFNDVQIDAIRSQIAEDILEGYKETTTVSFGLNVEEFGAAFGEDVENTLKSEINTYYETLFAEELEEQLANMNAKNNIDSIVKKSEMDEGVTIEDAIKDNYSFVVGMVACETAIKFFDEALKTSNLNVKREKMVLGARLATIGCAMSIEDADTLIKNPDDTKKDLMKKIAESAIDVVGKVIPQVEVAGKVMEAITITADLSMKALSMANKLDALAGFMTSPESIDEDLSAFFDALSNQYGKYTFDINNYEIIMGEYHGYLDVGIDYTVVNVPEEIYGFPVTGFSGCFAEKLDITEITIPSGVTSRNLTHVINNCDSLETVYYNAIACEGWYLGSFFYGCDSDFKVIIGEDVTIIPERFILNCGLSSIVFPEGITTMHAGTLMDCANLKTVTIPSTVTLFDIDFDAPSVISNCENLENVYYNAIDAEGSYFNGVFSHCGNNAEEMSIIFGENINSTPFTFLYDCGVKSVEFPEGMTLIREYAIANCQRLETITIPSTLTKFSENYVSDYVFTECHNLKTVNYNAKNAIGYLVNIFYNIQSGFEINFGEGIVDIPEYFIANCGITSITFPEGVVTINENCLVNCDSLEYVTVPTTVTTMGYNFVSDCENIDTIYYNATCIASPSSPIIEGCGNIDNPHMKVVLGENVTTVPANFIENCGISTFAYPEGVVNINANSLINCNALKTVVIPSTVTAISNNVVSESENLSDIYYGAINAQMISSNGYVFNNCGNTSDLEIHFVGDIEAIPSQFMYNCGVSSVTFPEGITTMGGNILVACEKLETVTIPSTLSTNGGNIICSCDSLKTLNYASNINDDDLLHNKAIVYDCETDFFVNFGTSVNRLPSNYINYCGITAIDLPESITRIGYMAFYGCKSLASIRFGNPDCIIYDSGYTIPTNTTLYGYFDSTAYAYAVKYNRDFELIEEEHTGTLGVNDNFYYKYDETTQTLTIIGDDAFELYTDEDGSKYVDMPDYTVKKVLFRNCTFTGSLYGLLGKYKNSVEEVIFEDCNTKNVTNMSKMFSGCCNLTTLDVGGFDTSSVVDMSELFVGCWKLKNIDISSFKLYSGCNTNSMFSTDLCVEVINTPYYMDEDIEIMLPYEFVDESGEILTSITSENRRETINIHRITMVVGDVNSDGVVDNLDRLTLSRYLADWEGYTADIINMVATDVNNDGEVDNLDRMVLSRHLADWEGYEALPYTE